MNKQIALDMVGKLAKASIHHYAVIKGDRKGSLSMALREQWKAAYALLKALSPDEQITDEEIDRFYETQ